MGMTQGAPQETQQNRNAGPDLCWLCLSRYERERIAVCTCSHCSHPLCSDCMRDHINELPQNVAQLSQQLHDLEQLLQAKQTMVQEEISESTEEVKQYFKNYQNDLFEANHSIIVGIEKEKQNAEKYLHKIHSELTTISGDIETLAGESVFQPKRLEALMNQLSAVEEKLQTYNVTRDTELKTVLPKYILQFEHHPATTTEIPPRQPSHSQDNVRKKSSHRHQHHPYKNTRTKTLVTKPTSSYDDDETNNK